MRTTIFIISSVIITAIITGCAHEAEKIKPAQELYNEADALAKKGKVEKAAEAFMQVRTYYPAHELARKSLLSTGDLYYDHEDYENALKSYDEFRLLYPTDVNAGYCLYRIGMCHYKQLGTFDRDQNETTKAIQNFDAFLKGFPESPHAADAKERLKEARTLLARHYLSIGKFYLNKGNKKAACNRFQMVKNQYRDIELGEDLDGLISTACTTSVSAVK